MTGVVPAGDAALPDLQPRLMQPRVRADAQHHAERGPRRGSERAPPGPVRGVFGGEIHDRRLAEPQLPEGERRQLLRAAFHRLVPEIAAERRQRPHQPVPREHRDAQLVPEGVGQRAFARARQPADQDQAGSRAAPGQLLVTGEVRGQPRRQGCRNQRYRHGGRDPVRRPLFDGAGHDLRDAVPAVDVRPGPVVTRLDAGHRDGCERHRPLPDPCHERLRREQRRELRREHVRGVAAPVRVAVQAVKDPVEAVGGRARNQVPHAFPPESAAYVPKRQEHYPERTCRDPATDRSASSGTQLRNAKHSPSATSSSSDAAAKQAANSSASGSAKQVCSTSWGWSYPVSSMRRCR